MNNENKELHTFITNNANLKDYDFKSIEHLNDMTIRAVHWYEVGFLSRSLTNIIFEDFFMQGVYMSATVMNNVKFKKIDSINLHLADSVLNEVLFEDCNLDGIDLRRAEVKSLKFVRTRMSNVSLAHKDITILIEQLCDVDELTIVRKEDEYTISINGGKNIKLKTDGNGNLTIKAKDSNNLYLITRGKVNHVDVDCNESTIGVLSDAKSVRITGNNLKIVSLYGDIDQANMKNITKGNLFEIEDSNIGSLSLDVVDFDQTRLINSKIITARFSHMGTNDLSLKDCKLAQVTLDSFTARRNFVLEETAIDELIRNRTYLQRRLNLHISGSHIEKLITLQPNRLDKIESFKLSGVNISKELRGKG